MLWAAVAHAATARTPGWRPHAQLRGRAGPGDQPASRDPRRVRTHGGAGAPTPVLTFQCGQLSGPEEPPAPIRPERRALPGRGAPLRAGAGGHGRPRGPGKSLQCRRAGDPSADPMTPAPPVSPAPSLQGHRSLRPPASPRGHRGTRRPHSHGAPVWFAAPTPPLPSAPRPAPSHLPHAPLRSAGPAPKPPLPDFHFLSLYRKTRSAVPLALRSGAAAPSPAAARGPGASPPPPPPARRSAPRARALAAARSARLPAPPAALRAPCPDVTGSHGGRRTSVRLALRPAPPSRARALVAGPGRAHGFPAPRTGARALALPDAPGTCRRGDR